MNGNDNQAAFQLSQPWFSYQRMLVALFGQDSQVLVGDIAPLDEDGYAIEIQVSDEVKAAALKEILDTNIDFGGVVVTTTILGISEKSASDMDEAARMEAAFAGNPLFVKIVTEGPYPTDAVYCVFAPVVLQFWNDNLNDYQGNVSVLPADLAKDILITEVHCCTEQL